MRDFFKYAAASALGTLVGLFSLVALLGVGAFGLASFFINSATTEAEPEVEKNSILVFDLSTDIVDAVPFSGPGVVLEETLYGSTYRAISLNSALKAIEIAAKDSNITGIYLTGNTNAGFATLKEIRAALEKFKADSGKPVLANNTVWGERDYYLVSVADSLYLNPAGLIELNGFSAEIQFLAGALSKYGVGVQVLRAGRYKSAIEPFTRSTSSPEEKQQTQALLTDLWQEFLATSSEARETTPETMQAIAENQGLLPAAEAETAGLIDDVAFYDDVVSELRELTKQTNADWVEDEDDFTQISLYRYSQILRPETGKDTVAVVYASGEIVDSDSSAPGLITSGGLSDTLRQVRHDDDIQAVVLRINSPGGSAIASEIIAREVELLAAEKPVIVSMGNFAASGGYMIAAPGDQIFATPGTITGSIGVYGLRLNFKEIANRNGVTWDVIKTAKLADINTISRPQSEDELKLQQGFVNTLYDRFLELVADGRELPKAEIDQVAQGRVWSGTDAQAANLVDQIGGLQDAIAAAAEAAELDDWQVEELPKPPSFEEQLFESIFGAGIVAKLPWAQDPISQELIQLREDLTLLKTLNDPQGVYMRLPFTTEIE
ncbi:signal peptide peptidase 67k type [Leptolyngbya sp. Heron Island J]|uniref:signal peptide peptidase SppA n=1 Tax=Leptolyngbya sp. Heron Island J TaxID=1385935 RepID=UPI0003B974B1|nr:signal peptide peptidase SppA [Leptolyngbya sp. Heron Island J]ESA32300.1 signal peptide peptidase 67k type [Leptolyngbya sp. Heron Island J]